MKFIFYIKNCFQVYIEVYIEKLDLISELNPHRFNHAMSGTSHPSGRKPCLSVLRRKISPTSCGNTLCLKLSLLEKGDLGLMGESSSLANCWLFMRLKLWYGLCMLKTILFGGRRLRLVEKVRANFKPQTRNLNQKHGQRPTELLYSGLHR